MQIEKRDMTVDKREALLIHRNEILELYINETVV